jgi:hypothetical protein
MKNLKFIFVSVLLILGLLIFNGLKADVIYSTGLGGYWNDPYTWTDTIVPTPADDVFIVGPVEVESGTECASLTVEAFGDLFGEWWYGGNINVYGDVENLGTIRHVPQAPNGALQLSIHGDIIQNGTWSCQQTNLIGTFDQYLTFNNVFSGASFSIDKPTGNTIANTDLEFQDTDLHLNNKPLQVQNLLSLNSCKLHDGFITSSAPEYELYMSGTDYYIFDLITTGVRLTGYVIIGTPVTVNGNLVVEGIMENYYWSWADIIVNGNITNNGTIRNNATIGNRVAIESTGDIINNGIWESHVNKLMGNTDQTITLIGDTPINSDVRFDATTGKTSYQWYKDGSIIPGQTNSFLSLNPLTNAEYGLYTCLIDGTTWTRNFIVQDTTSEVQEYTLAFGYQFISSRIISENPDMLEILGDNLENLDFVRNTSGQMLRKIGPVWVNSIGDWATIEGYLFKMNDPDLLTISGSAIDPQTPINLVFGYQIISYLPEFPINTSEVFADVLSNLDFVRNTAGQMFRKIGPNWVNSIGDMQPCEGYLVRMNADDVLIYPETTEKMTAHKTPKPEHYKVMNGNPNDPVWTIYFEQGVLNIGDEVGVYDGEILVGASVVNSDNIFENSIPVFSNLFESGNYPTFKIWNKTENKEYLLNDYSYINPYGDAYPNEVFPKSDGEYSILNFSITGISIEENDHPSLSVYPNPSEGIFNISIEGVSGKVEIKVFDVHANEYRFFEIDGIRNITTEKLDLKELPAGIYFISFKGRDLSKVEKIVIN